MKIKRCTVCGKFLGEDSFNWTNKKKGYRKSLCKKCSSTEFYLWRLDNEEYFNEYYKQWRKDNQEKYIGYQKQWCEDNKDHIAEYQKEWNTCNYNKKIALNAKRRVKKKNQTVFLTDLEKDRVKFIYKVASTMKDGVVDHIQPISKGGSDHPDNLQILTRELNAQKHNKWPLTSEEKIKYTGFKI